MKYKCITCNQTFVVKVDSLNGVRCMACGSNRLEAI